MEEIDPPDLHLNCEHGIDKFICPICNPDLDEDVDDLLNDALGG